MICFRHLSHVDACTRSGNRLQQVPSQFATVVANISSDFCTSVLLKESSYQAWKALPIVEPSIGIGIRLDMLNFQVLTTQTGTAQSSHLPNSEIEMSKFWLDSVDWRHVILWASLTCFPSSMPLRKDYTRASMM